MRTVATVATRLTCARVAGAGDGALLWSLPFTAYRSAIYAPMITATISVWFVPFDASQPAATPRDVVYIHLVVAIDRGSGIPSYGSNSS